MKQLSIAVLGVSLAMPVGADEGSDFVAAFAAAVNGKERQAWEAFLSPGARACLSGPGKEMLDGNFRSDTRERVAPDSKVHVTRIAPGEPLMFEGMLTYPDRPTHYFQIDLGPPGRSTRSLIRYGRLQGGRWQYVFGCPTAAGIAQAQQNQGERAAADSEARRRAAALPAKLAARVRALIAEQRIIDATKAVAGDTGVDLATARGIVRAIEAEGRTK